jgi:hypothetical protein
VQRSYAEFQRYNFFCPPDWRWDRVLRLCARCPRPGRCTRRDDDYIRKARAFYLRWAEQETEQSREQLGMEEPALYRAFELYERTPEEPEGALFLQARLLARQPYAQIADALATAPATVEWYEALFFNVADRLQNTDWITMHVLLPAVMRNRPVPVDADEGRPMPFCDSVVARPFLDGSLKFFAYFGGPQVVDVMIAGFQAGKPLRSREDMAAWFDDHWALTIKRRSAQAALQVEVTQSNVMGLFATHAKMMKLVRSQGAADQQCTTTERHIQAMLDELAGVVGPEGIAAYANAGSGRFDKLAAKLTEEEFLKLVSGATLAGPQDQGRDPLPPPRS